MKILIADVKAAMSTEAPAQRTVVDVRQPTLAEAVANSQRYKWKVSKWKELTDAIAYFIAKPFQVKQFHTL